jgi:Mg2+ and Co2+ transporter CorA
MKPIEITPKMEHVRIYSWSAAFDPFAPLRRFYLQAADGAVLMDLFISANSRCGAFSSGEQLAVRYPSNVRLGLIFTHSGQSHEIDFTSEYLQQVRESLDKLDQQLLRKMYKDGMEHALTALGPFWGYLQPADTKGQQQMEAQLALEPISTHLTAIGAVSENTLAGVLSLSNFINTFIPVPAVSLGALLRAKQFEIQEISDLCVWASHRPPQAPFVVGGQVDVTLQAIFHNELIDEFDDLEHKIKSRLLAIHETLSANGPILGQLAKTKDNLMRLYRQLSDLDAALQDQATQIDSLNSLAKRLDDNMDALLSVSTRNRVDAIEQRLTLLERKLGVR